ncbi:MAG: Mobile element protein, partial [Olavius algarvensis Gamma 1 endosymbiont]
PRGRMTRFILWMPSIRNTIRSARVVGSSGAKTR